MFRSAACAKWLAESDQLNAFCVGSGAGAIHSCSIPSTWQSGHQGGMCALTLNLVDHCLAIPLWCWWAQLRVAEIKLSVHPVFADTVSNQMLIKFADWMADGKATRCRISFISVHLSLPS
jgi:hypothetical protein